MATDLERSRDLLQEGIDLAEGAGLNRLGGLFRTLMAQILVELGDTEGAALELEGLRAETAEHEYRVTHHMTRIHWMQATGDLEGARRLLERTEPLVRGLGGFAQVYIEPTWRTLAAELAWAEGDVERAWAEAGRAWWLSRSGSDMSGLGALEILSRLTEDTDPRWAAELLGYSAGLRGVLNTASVRIGALRSRLARTLGEVEAERLITRGSETPRARILENMVRWLEPIVPDDVEAGDWRR